jgi:tetratricopeptide (TPR) repeat protein
MEINQNETDKLRRFLLGVLTDDEEFAIGEKMVSDGEYFDQVSMLEEEIIDKYLSGRLSTDDRSRFETYFLIVPRRWEKLQMARALKRYVDQQPEMLDRPAANGSETMPVRLKPAARAPFLFSAYLKAAAAVAALVVLGFVGFRVFIYRTDLQKGQELFMELYQNERPTEGRISSLAYAPFVDRRGEAPHTHDDEDIKRKAAASLLELAVKENPRPASEHAFGELSLAAGNFDEAIKHLTTAVNGEPNNFVYSSDLAAAWLAKSAYDRTHGSADQSSQDLQTGLASADNSLRLHPDFQPALFNRALCLQALGKWRDAEDAWTKYLTEDPNSPWAQEASRNLELAKQKLRASSL